MFVFTTTTNILKLSYNTTLKNVNSCFEYQHLHLLRHLVKVLISI